MGVVSGGPSAAVAAHTGGEPRPRPAHLPKVRTGLYGSPPGRAWEEKPQAPESDILSFVI